MSSLVANYSSDDDSDDQPSESTETSIVQCEELSEQKPSATGTNYLISQDDSDEDESSVSEDVSAQTAKEKLPSPLLGKLPKPSLGKKKKRTKPGKVKKTMVAGSVFINPFENAEMAKQSILEKHVKMTEKQDVSGNKGKICKKFKMLGNCRFGKNCKYSHDLDESLSLRYKQDDAAAETDGKDAIASKRPNIPRLPPPPRGFMGTINTLQTHPRPRYSQQQTANFYQQERYMQGTNEEDDDKFNVGDKRKKRVGVSQSLVPPKKAMSALQKQRMEERPWTVGNP